MKKNTVRVLSSAFIASLFLLSCSSDDESITPDTPATPEEIDLNIADLYKINRSELLNISPDLSAFETPEISWTITGFNNDTKDSLVGNESNLYFITLKEGTYNVKLNVTEGEISAKKEFAIQVNHESEEYKYYIANVLEFVPSYGQFTNTLPKYEEGDTAETMRQKAEEKLATDKPSMISLGGFGGSVTFAFDHTVTNVAGERDFRILGNAFKNSSEPGIIMVAFDKNKNGKPDEDEWYEIAGSEHNNPETIKNYEITFYKPTAELDAATGNIEEYIRWEDNQGNEGWKSKNSFHNQSYYPLWAGESITFKGTKLPNNAIDTNGKGTNWALPEFAWGYADNYPNNNDEAAIDIDWAVDQNGNKVQLPGVDFIKVYTGMNQEAGWLGETSTEVAGAEDLHIKGESIATR